LRALCGAITFRSSGRFRDSAFDGHQHFAREENDDGIVMKTLRSAVQRRRPSSDKEIHMRTTRLVAAIAIAMLALPAAAGSWPNFSPAKAPAKAAQAKMVRAPSQSLDGFVAGYVVNGFEYVGGEPGWQPAGHKLVWSGGRFAHSDQCDHVIRIAKAPSAADVEYTRSFSPGG